jgi:phosphatidylserine/phosphatidylglycerophosphate/cardiolipin synthase-like enzyme
MTNHLFSALGLALIMLMACAPRHGEAPAPLPTVVPHPVDTADPGAPGQGARHAMNYMVLSREGPAEGQDRYYFSGVDAGRISVSFLSRSRAAITAHAICDGRARSRPDEILTQPPAWVAAGQAVIVNLGPMERRHTLLDLGPEVTQCDLTVTPGGYPSYAIRMLREDLARPEIARLDARHRACGGGAGGGGDALTRAFLAADGLSMTCPAPIGQTRMLPDGLDALNAKIEALTGSTVSPEALLAGDPTMPLDWSNAPDLDLIYVNYLNLNADFSGYLIARMLAWHAARGTIVRLLTSGVMLTDTDRALFEGLAARYPTVQLQPYRFPPAAADGVEGQLGRLHRVSHVKLFGTVARDPGRSRVMIGGRNAHEGYFFDEPRDLSAFPYLHQYDPEQTKLTGGFTAYEDFEIEFRSDAATRAVMGHMAALWHRDHDTQSLRPPVSQAVTSTGRVEGQFRHFISVPFADGMAQVGYYTQLIDAARHRIRIASPYLNLPPELDEALHRAQARGVLVDVVTTVRVREATDFMVTGLNRAFANDFGAWVNFIDYDPYPRLLHTKLIVIDDRLVVIASTNLNMRSFAHDLENGLMIMDREVARRVSAVLQGYMDAGTRVPAGQEVPRLVRFLRRIGVIARAF